MIMIVVCMLLSTYIRYIKLANHLKIEKIKSISLENMHNIIDTLIKSLNWNDLRMCASLFILYVHITPEYW